MTKTECLVTAPEQRLVIEEEFNAEELLAFVLTFASLRLGVSALNSCPDRRRHSGAEPELAAILPKLTQGGTACFKLGAQHKKLQAELRCASHAEPRQMSA